MKFRWHRGSLQKSLETVADFDGSKESLVVLLKDSALCWFPALDLDHVSVEPYGGIDQRINWDTHIVLVQGNAVGFTDGMVHDKYSCPVCGAKDGKYLTCQRPDCADGRELTKPS